MHSASVRSLRSDGNPGLGEQGSLLGKFVSKLKLIKLAKSLTGRTFHQMYLGDEYVRYRVT